VCRARLKTVPILRPRCNYALSEKLSLYFNVKNLLNTPQAFYEGTPDRPIQREFYGQDYLFGVRYDFEKM
jgi:hypothetical protein